MKGYWILWTGLVICGACSLSRQRNNETHYAVQSDTREIGYQHIVRQDTAVGQTWHSTRHLHELSVFKPHGMVSYHPDSGLRGQMEEVWVYRARTEIADSTSNRHGSVTKQEAMQEQETHHSKTTSHTEEMTVDRRTRPLPGWVWAVALIAGSLVFLYRMVRR